MATPLVSLFVYCKNRLPGKTFSTFKTCKWLFPCVSSCVRNKIGSQRETPPALWAWIGLLPCVDLLMPKEVWLLRKALPTFRTWKGLLPCVDFFMSNKVWFLGEAFPTFWTWKGVHSRVSSLMWNKVGTLLKGLSAVHTGKWLLSRVRPLVCSKFWSFTKTFSTIWTWYALRTSMIFMHCNGLKIIRKPPPMWKGTRWQICTVRCWMEIRDNGAFFCGIRYDVILIF